MTNVGLPSVMSIVIAKYAFSSSILTYRHNFCKHIDANEPTFCNFVMEDFEKYCISKLFRFAR